MEIIKNYIDTQDLDPMVVFLRARKIIRYPNLFFSKKFELTQGRISHAFAGNANELLKKIDKELDELEAAGYNENRKRRKYFIELENP